MEKKGVYLYQRMRYHLMVIRSGRMSSNKKNVYVNQNLGFSNPVRKEFDDLHIYSIKCNFRM